MAKIRKTIESKNDLDILDLLKEQPELLAQLSQYLKEDEKLVLRKKSELIEIHSDNYMVVDTDVLDIVKKEISDVDYNRLFSLGVLLKTRFNILFNHTAPFTLDSLSKKLGVNKENTSKFINRMVAKGIMAYTVCAPSGYVEKIYAMNPQLIRRGRYYDKEFVTTFFKDYAKELNKQI